MFNVWEQFSTRDMAEVYRECPFRLKLNSITVIYSDITGLVVRNIENNQLNLHLLIYAIHSKHKNDNMFHVNRTNTFGKIRTNLNCFCFEDLY